MIAQRFRGERISTFPPCFSHKTCSDPLNLRSPHSHHACKHLHGTILANLCRFVWAHFTRLGKRLSRTHFSAAATAACTPASNMHRNTAFMHRPSKTTRFQRRDSHSTHRAQRQVTISLANATLSAPHCTQRFPIHSPPSCFQ